MLAANNSVQSIVEVFLKLQKFIQGRRQLSEIGGQRWKPGGQSFDDKLLQYFKSYVDCLWGGVVNFVSPLSNTAIWRWLSS